MKQKGCLKFRFGKKWLSLLLTVMLIASTLVVDVLPANAVIATAAAVPVGIFPHGVAVNPVTNKIYVTSFDNSVTVIDGATNTATGTAISVGTAPEGVAVNPVTNKIYVANSGDNSVTVIDGATGTTTGTAISVETAPYGVAVNPVTNKIYVVNSGDNSVTVIDGATNATIGTAISVGSYPVAVAVNTATNKIYVTNSFDNSVTVIDGATNTATGTAISVGTAPNGVAVNPVTNKIYVTNNGAANSVTVIDGATDTTSGPTISVGTAPNGVAVNPVTNKIYVANYGANSVTVIDGATDTTSGPTISVGTPYGVAVNATTNKIYVANNGANSVTVIDGARNAYTTITNSIPTGSKPGAMAVNPVTNKIYVANRLSNNVTVIDGATGTTTGTAISVGVLPLAVAVNPDTNKIYVVNRSDNSVTVIDGATDTTIGTAIPVGGSPSGLAVNPVTNKIYVACSYNNSVTVIDGATDTTSQISVGLSFCAVAVNTNTNKIYVVNYSTNSVTVIDALTDTVIGTPIPVGTNPQGVAVNEATNKIYVTNMDSRSVTVIDGVTNDTTSIFLGQSPWKVAVNPDTNKIYATHPTFTGNSISVIDGATNTSTGISVGNYAIAVDVNPVTNKIYVANMNSDDVTVLNPPSPTGDILGTVTDGTYPVAGANVSLTVNGSVYSAVAGADGIYCLQNVPTGTDYAVSASKTGYNGSATANANVTVDTTTLGVNLTLSKLYTVSSGTLTGGTITANRISATAGSAITLTVTPDTGKQLQAGSLKYNDGSDHAITGTSFTMPAANVMVSAVFEAIPNTGGHGGGGGGGGSPSTGGTTVTGSIIDSNGTQVSNLTATVTTGSNGNYTVSMKATQTVMLKQPDGTKSPLGDLSKVTFATAAGSPVTVSADGTINLTNLDKGTNNHFNITYDLGNGQTITIGTMDVTVSSSGAVSLTCTLIDPYGVIIDAATGKPIAGANVTLYYANTDRNKTNGKTPDTVVPLPGIDGFKPNNNINPQLSDPSGAYGFMVFPTTDYYLVATKDGYNNYTSPTISVEQDIVKWDFKMNQTTSGVTRLSGLSRVDTALAIAQANYTGTVSNVILATADNYPDALAGSVLAYKLNAPILLVGSSDADQEKVLSYMKSNLDPAGTVYILGGTAVVSSALEGKVTAIGFANITRLGGTDRYETSVKIAEQLKVKTGTPIMLAYGENYPDALSISSIAAEMQYPILLVQKDGLSDAVKNEIAAIKPTKVYIIGGTGVISSTVDSQVAQITSLANTNIVRIAGTDRYETSLAVAQYFNLSGQSVCIATGNNFPDALAGSVYAANHNAPIILADGSLPDQVMNYLKGKKLTRATLFGGEAVVSKNIEQQLGQLMGK